MLDSHIQITKDKSKIQIDYVHNFLSKESYWAKNIPLDIVKKSIENSLCYTVLKEEKQIGFARVITDQASFCYLCDVFIDGKERGRGYSKLLMEYIMNDEVLQGLRRYMLGTLDAHGLYERFGFKSLSMPERIMEIRNSDIYS